MARLYELTDAYAFLRALLCDDLTPDEEQDIYNQLSRLQESIGNKGGAYAKVMLDLLANIAAIDTELDRLTALKKRINSRVDKLLDNIHYAMEIAGATEIHTDIGTWRIKRNPPKVEVTDASLIPEAYLKPQPPEVDKLAILAAYRQDGELIPGTEIVRKEVAVFK